MKEDACRIIRQLAAAALVILGMPAFSRGEPATKTLTLTSAELIAAGAATLDLSFALGGTRVTITPVDDPELGVQAVVSYDTLRPEPGLSTSVSGSTFSARFKSGYDSYPYDIPEIEVWNITIGAYDIDTSFAIAGGGVSGNIELGGLPLVNCDLALGGVDVRVSFSSPTTRQVDNFNIEGGGISLSVSGIGNTDFQTFQMAGGGCIADLDFHGAFSDGPHNATFVGAGNRMRIEVPATAGESVSIIAVAALVGVRGAGWQATRQLFFLQNHVTDDYDEQSVTLDLNIIVAGSLVTVVRQ